MSKSVDIRHLALESLLAIDEEGRPSHLVIRDVLETYRFLPERDRALYVRLVEGVLERRILLDYILNYFSKIHTERMKPAVREILRMGVYQLRFLSVPDHAAVSEAVKLTSRCGFFGLRGFVNGVLRSVARGTDDVVFPDRAETVPFLSVQYSVPEWLCTRWVGLYGAEEAETICASFLGGRPMTVRLRPEEEARVVAQSLAEEGVEVTRREEHSDLFDLDKVGDIRQLAAFREGRVVVQDASSQLAVRAAGISPGDKVLDLCAAPGGKTLLAADLAGEGGSVTAMDITESKMRLLRENLIRCHIPQAETILADATVFVPRFASAFDVVIADLPCSGYGVIGRKPEIRYRASAEREEELMRLQRAILAQAVRYVRPGGTLLYSTCTFGTGECQETASWIVEQFDFVMAQERQFLPGIDPCDGFYYAVLVQDGN